jgi:hypothetical protein
MGMEDGRGKMEVSHMLQPHLPFALLRLPLKLLSVQIIRINILPHLRRQKELYVLFFFDRFS